MTDLFDDRKTRAAAWFRTLRDQIVAAFEAIEDDFGGPAPAGRFEVTPTTRPDGAPIVRPVAAQDTGGAIVGEVRADLFWGTGDAAGLYGWFGAAGTCGLVNMSTGLRHTLMTQYMPSTAYPLQNDFPVVVAQDFAAHHGQRG